MIPMRDGIRLYTAIYAPKDTSKPYPFLMERTPYSAGPYGKDKFPRQEGPTPEFSKRGYIFVVQDVRGRYMSEGTHIFSPPHNPNKTGTDHDESSDTYDSIEWLLKNVPNHNGKVGLWGISQPGFYATNSLFSGHPAIAAVSPQAPVTDRFRGDDDHHNGAFFLAQRFRFLNNFGAPRPIPAKEVPPTFSEPILDQYRYFLDLGPLPNAQRKFKNRNQFWNQSMSHGTYDEYWKPRGVEQHLKNLSGPAVLVVGGWFDAEDLYGALHTYGGLATQSPATKSYLVMGPWTHGGWAGGTGDRLGGIEFGPKNNEFYRDSIVLPFFEHYLRGGPDPKLPTATVFESGGNKWHSFDQWPPALPAGSLSKTWSLSAKGQLLPAAAPKGSDSYVSDPRRPVPYTAEPGGSVRSTFMIENQRFAWERSDVLSYVSEPLKQDSTLAGPIVADLLVSTTSTDADFVVKIIDEYPADAPPNTATNPIVKLAGYQMLIRAEVMRGKFRNSLETPVPFEPGKPTRVRYTLPDVFHTLKKGHRLMVQVQSSWFPLTDLNPQTFTDIYHAKESDFRAAKITLHYGPEGSKVELPFVTLPAAK